MNADRQTADSHRVARTLHLAWIVWFALLAVTLLSLAGTLYVVFSTPARDAAPATARRWIWVIVGYYLVVVIAAFFRTGWMFRGYYSSYQPVSPRAYLTGMTVVWTALAVGALASLAVCALTRSLLPFLLAGVGNVMLLALWPKGNAMVPPVGNPDDPGQYQEPR